MSRYIDVDLKEAEIVDKIQEISANADVFIAVRRVLNLFPTADVEPVRHAHWITEKDPLGTVCRYTCSCCGEHWTPINGVHWLRFCGRCPNGSCGAKMNEEEEE